MKNFVVLFKIILINNFVTHVLMAHWDHSYDMNEDYRILWNVRDQEVTFEVQVKTLGYIGLGFSRDGTIYGSDIAIGWVDQGQAHFQDRHVKKHGDGEPVVDPSQDYVLLLGYENATHTVLRFRRKLDTCDTAHDIVLTNDTTRIVYMYHEDEPRRGSILPGSLPSPVDAFKGYRPIYLTQRVPVDSFSTQDPKLKILELRNQDVELPQGDETLHWCKIFKLVDINRKHHLIRYEPVFDSVSSQMYLHHIILYECQMIINELDMLSREPGKTCSSQNSVTKSCNAVVATWARGSEGFTFPNEAGYPLDSNQARFYLMETHYNNPESFDNYAVLQQPTMVDNSGLKLYYTQSLRKFDAGVLSIGMEPNWRHIIPPGQDEVVSEGHCVEECTRQAFTYLGINVFAVMMRTHAIGKQFRLRQIRGREELTPIAQDNNIDPNYLEYRRLPNTVKILPGDRLIAECKYDSSSRKSITLGGITTKEETCIVLTLYYPRQKKLSSCQSLPSLPTVLHSLGIQELVVGSNPVMIASPPDLAGMTLESRLVTYDWENQFESFQEVTRRGSFKPLCWSAKNTIIPGTDYIEGYAPNLTKIYKPTYTCSMKTLLTHHTSSSEHNNRHHDMDVPQMDDDESNNIIEIATKSKVSRSSSVTETMGLSKSSQLYSNNNYNIIILIIINTILILFVPFNKIDLLFLIL